MKNYFIASILIISGTIFQSCSNDDDSGVDTQKPIISLNQPTEHQIFLPGGSILINADFSDNVELRSYKIEIHSGDDGHTHKTAEEAGWFYTESVEIEPGLTHKNIDKSIVIPTEINGLPILEGHYHLGIYLIDRAANEQHLFTEIVIGEDDDH